AFLAGIRIVMVNTTLPANIGSAARAMHTMGLTQLTVVSPKLPIDEDAYAHAAGAKAILDTVTICDTLEQALQDCHWVIATSSRQRHIPRPVLSPRQAAELMVTNFQNLDDVMTDSAHRNWQLAIVFGREDRGLTNEELQLADYHIQIPANAEYGVLNVAAAVQVIASVFYETAELALTAKTAAEKSINLTFRQHWDEPPISNEQRLQLENRLLALLENLDIYNPAQSKVMPQRINRLLSRLQLDIKEYQLLQATIAKLLKS
ncbi:MAG TPA: rRNA methyltransferase, partial [Moraxella sp.]|nr:rRNA methyltransferase [Moraxella sp.]